ncbi:hypothetical protein [Bacillus wiedmannii]|uniref:DUF4367 domain-containing protein n=1 Tax=Bacillus wiedmannii TaxID=1890302 RepID=A0A2B6SFP0_9BACI|nr:hypothetical protein [Bacillus wiedmannii]PGD39601.1 hypothetical protein COM27_02175 [Bacillus wiedmannii]
MKKSLFVNLFFVTMLTGCFVKDVNLYPISQEVMATVTKDPPFPISYPTKLPFEVDSMTMTVVDENAKRVSIIYSSKEDQRLIVEITKREGVLPQKSSQEINAFDKTRQAFDQKKNEVHHIDWNEKNVHYRIYSPSNEKKKQLTKEELSAVQKSFSAK